MKNRISTTSKLVVLLGAASLIAIAVRGVMPLMAGEVKSNVASPVLLHDGEAIVIPAQSALRDTLKTAVIEQHDIAIPFSLPASVEADPARLARVLPPTTGRIVAIQKRLGDEVRAGDILFEVESSDLAQALSDDRKAQAALALTRRSLERQRSLDQANISARRDLEQAQNDYEQADSEAARSRARVAALGATRTSGTVGTVAASGVGARLAVRSPVSGHVIELNAAVGNFWNDATAAVMTVADLSSVYVTASAQEKDLARVYAGQDAEVALDAYPGQVLRARVRSVAPVLDPDTRTVKVRILAANKDERLKPGMFAQVTLRDHAHAGMLMPMSAVVQTGFANRVFVEVAPWKFEARKVVLGAQVGNDIEVTDGLQSGARVVVRDGVLLND